MFIFKYVYYQACLVFIKNTINFQHLTGKEKIFMNCKYDDRMNR